MKFLLVALLVLVGAGCATPETRIRDNPALFASFPPDMQTKIRQGQIAIGFSQAAVRMALGEPARVYHRATTQGTNEVWAYTSYEYRTLPQYTAVMAPVSGPWLNSAYPPGVVLLDVQQRQEYEALRVEFEGDKVTAIEALKN